MSAKRYNEEFKKEAVKQITEDGYAVADVARKSFIGGIYGNSAGSENKFVNFKTLPFVQLRGNWALLEQ